jgi:hypothetical protein
MMGALRGSKCGILDRGSMVYDFGGGKNTDFKDGGFTNLFTN